MAYISTYVDIDLNEIKTGDLIDELESRHLGKTDQASLLSLLKNQDRDKIDLFFEIKDNYSLFELQELFNAQSSAYPIPKEQLKLAII